jgi:hypothetical protein
MLEYAQKGEICMRNQNMHYLIKYAKYAKINNEHQMITFSAIRLKNEGNCLTIKNKRYAFCIKSVL